MTTATTTSKLRTTQPTTIGGIIGDITDRIVRETQYKLSRWVDALDDTNGEIADLIEIRDKYETEIKELSDIVAKLTKKGN